MSDPKPPEGYETWLEYALAKIQRALLDHTFLFEQSNLEYARAEYATLLEKPTWDETFKITCHPCYKGHEIRRDGEGWCHPRGKYKLVCHASQLRTAALKAQERKDTDHDDA